MILQIYFKTDRVLKRSKTRRPAARGCTKTTKNSVVSKVIRFFIFEGFFIFWGYFCWAPKAAADLCYAKLKNKNLRPYSKCSISGVVRVGQIPDFEIFGNPA